MIRNHSCELLDAPGSSVEAPGVVEKVWNLLRPGHDAARARLEQRITDIHRDPEIVQWIDLLKSHAAVVCVSDRTSWDREGKEVAYEIDRIVLTPEGLRVRNESWSDSVGLGGPCFNGAQYRGIRPSEAESLGLDLEQIQGVLKSIPRGPERITTTGRSGLHAHLAAEIGIFRD